MKIIKNLQVPTGNILVVEGSKGLLECLSIGDYGKEKNIKADFMGLSREICGVPNGDIIPLEEKWVITISSQYGCSMRCSFCDVPNVGAGRNASMLDMVGQIQSSMDLHPEVTHSNRLNIHFARMGEPTWNAKVISTAEWLYDNYNNKYNVHPVVSTMMPCYNKDLEYFLDSWMIVKNDTYNGNAGLQLSINSTNEYERIDMFKGNACSLEVIGSMVDRMQNPKGRKLTLNFALAGYEIDPNILLEYFNPEYFMCKITPMHMTRSCITNGLVTHDGYSSYYPYRDIENRLKDAGYDVIVFIPSEDEDNSRITCGNAILSSMATT